jgi:hypothetical protein
MALTSITTRDGRYVQGGDTDQLPDRLGWWERKLLTTSTSDIAVLIQPQFHQRPDKMAAVVYGKSSLMWLVLQYNNIIDVNVEFVTGATIMLPPPSRVQRELLTRSPNLSK